MIKVVLGSLKNLYLVDSAFPPLNNLTQVFISPSPGLASRKRSFAAEILFVLHPFNYHSQNLHHKYSDCSIIHYDFYMSVCLQCCGCFGPVGGKKNYCGAECTAKNGGTTEKNVYTWFWVRSSLPKKVWNKCMEYKVTVSPGKEVWYKLYHGNNVPVLVSIYYFVILTRRYNY